MKQRLVGQCKVCQCGISVERGNCYLSRPGYISSYCKACARAGEADRKRLNRVGLNRRQYEELESSQGDRCAICGKRSYDKALSVDMVRGNVVGLVCCGCLQAVRVTRKYGDNLMAYLGNRD